MIYLSRFEKLHTPENPGYPFTVPLIANAESFEFSSPITVFAGDNGSGKTTLLELLAAKLSAVRIGSGNRGERRAMIERAAASFRAVRARTQRLCFYFTAEDFSRELEARMEIRRDAEEALREIEEGYGGRSAYAKGLASMPFARTIGEMDGQYRTELSERSHGEGFLDFFGKRLVRGGLYLLDEPEAALTYFNQLVLLNMIRDAAAEDCQFILSTHSPVLCACPGAELYELRPEGAVKTDYDSLSNVRFLRMFLGEREKLLRS
ncbi:MAG TPA: AAA family ATPase [Clostridia bacterium]|nr:AAA family ATPase [Clostridia bacterium]